MKKIVYYIVVTIICIIGLPFSFLFKEKWNEFGRSVDRFFGVKSRHTKRFEKDLCQTCEHHWLDFPMPLDRYIAHCEVLDKMGGKLLDDVVDYPCLKCPFDSYRRKEDNKTETCDKLEKVDTKLRTCDKLEMEKLYGEEY